MTDWEARYQGGDTPWEKGHASPALVELLESQPDWGNGPILVPGCGFGHDVRALGELRVPVLGLDLAVSAVRRARELAQTEFENYELGDFLDPAWREGREFSAIWEHTCFCAIQPGDRPRYAEAVAGCLKEGGLLAGVFFLTPFDPDEEQAGPPFPTTVEELDTWFSPWFERIDGWVPGKAYPGRENREWIGLFRKIAQA
jgi:SAM-dependent methyltransferase